MISTVFDPILHQSYLHLLSYGLVMVILLAALADAFLIRQLRKVLRVESARLDEGGLEEADLLRMLHPVAPILRQLRDPKSPMSASTAQRTVELAEAALFVPLRARMMLTRDLSTLMGLIATLLALVAAANEFARHGQPELLVGSVGAGCVATCVAAVGCAVALWNLSRLTRLRLEVACRAEEILLKSNPEPESALAEEVPIQHLNQISLARLNPQPHPHHAPI